MSKVVRFFLAFDVMVRKVFVVMAIRYMVAVTVLIASAFGSCSAVGHVSIPLFEGTTFVLVAAIAIIIAIPIGYVPVKG